MAAEPARLPPVPHAEGYLEFGAGDIPEAAAAVETCREIWQNVRADDTQQPTLRARYSKQDFLLPVMIGDSAAYHPALLDFALSPSVLDTVTRYFGSVPVLAKVHVLWTKPNVTSRSSQMFHFDAEDTTELKLFLHVFDVDETTGPFTLLPATSSQRVKKQIRGKIGRVDDTRIRRMSGDEEWTVLTGPSGSGFFVDTARCFHFGSRENQTDRLMLMAQFIPYFGANFKATTWAPAVEASGRKLDPLQQMVMPA